MTHPVLPHTFPFDDALVPYTVELMRVGDVDRVMAIEEAAFPAPWPASAYRHELAQNELATYLVLRARLTQAPSGWRRVVSRWKQEPGAILAYGGFWAILDEAHISTIAVHPEWRGCGLGEMMLVALLDTAVLRAATQATLEVRVSNKVAQGLYAKYSFLEVGRRSRYYHDNNEDALIMTLSDLDNAAVQARYAQLKTSLRQRLATPADKR
jgi:[ribosomal protein S18]-alanine N-acetyltransferase